MIDLRSDTVTKPTAGMLQAMTVAEVGDDVFAEDPTVNAFEEKMAGLFGMEAGLFVPSGTMSNQLCLKVLTEPGDEVLIDETGHIFNYETAAAAHLSSVQLLPLKGRRGKLGAGLLRNRLRGRYDWEPKSRVIALENTTNKGGGACYSREELNAIREFATEQGLQIHLDGARIWNAISATEIDPAYFGSIADTLSVCFSKGLGAPVGSMMLSSRENVRKARRYRKMWGGGMRQIGLLAAAADYGVEHHWPKLKEDHRRAKALAETISECDKLDIDPATVESNIVIFDTLEEVAFTALEKLEAEGIRMVPFGHRTIRATFHFEIGDKALVQTQGVIKELFG